MQTKGGERVISSKAILTPRKLVGFIGISPFASRAAARKPSLVCVKND
jgi:hypothetical protein